MEFERQVSIPVVLRPDQIDDLAVNVVKVLMENTKGHCIENVGYVSDIVNISKVTALNITNKTGNANFTVYCTLKVIQPEIGTVIECTVTKYMYDKGVVAKSGPVEIFAKWIPAMRDINEHHTCRFKILQFRHDENRIICVGDLLM